MFHQYWQEYPVFVLEPAKKNRFDSVQFFILRDFTRNNRQIVQDHSKESFLIVSILNVQFSNCKRIVGCCSVCDKVNRLLAYYDCDYSKKVVDLTRPTSHLNCRHSIAAAAKLYLDRENEFISVDDSRFLELYMDCLTHSLINQDHSAKPNKWYESQFDYYCRHGILKLFFTDEFLVIIAAEEETDTGTLEYHCFVCPSRKECSHRSKLPNGNIAGLRSSRKSRCSNNMIPRSVNLISKVRYPFNLADDDFLVSHILCRINEGDVIFKNNMFRCQVLYE